MFSRHSQKTPSKRSMECSKTVPPLLRSCSAHGEKTMKGKSAKLLDSHALLSLVYDEPGSERVENLIRSAEKGELRLVMSAINLGECYYSISRRRTERDAERFLAQFGLTATEIVLPDLETIIEAARLKAQYRISHADCFAVATAQKFDASILTGDPDFKAVEEIVEIEWLK